MKTLSEHKTAFMEMQENQLTTECMRMQNKALGFSTMEKDDRNKYLVQSERDMRRLALHRVEEALNDGLGLEDLKEFVAFLIQESKDRQDEIERYFIGIELFNVRRAVCLGADCESCTTRIETTYKKKGQIHKW
jgi:hypothetical protein